MNHTTHTTNLTKTESTVSVLLQDKLSGWCGFRSERVDKSKRIKRLSVLLDPLGTTGLEQGRDKSAARKFSPNRRLTNQSPGTKHGDNGRRYAGQAEVAVRSMAMNAGKADLRYSEKL
jgi:hypothetical protein